MLPFETVGRILYLTEGGQAATPVGPVASAPDAKQLPQLRASVVATLRRAELRYGGRVEYDVMLERDDAIALRDWCREVAPLVASADTGLFLAAPTRSALKLSGDTAERGGEQGVAGAVGEDEEGKAFNREGTSVATDP